MSIQATFSKTLTSGLVDQINGLGNDVANELEFRLGSYVNSKFSPGQTLLQFKNIIENLQRKKYQLEESTSLDISFDNPTAPELKNIRSTVSSLINVRKYCLNENFSDIDKNSISYMRKTKHSKPHDYTEYGLRLQLAKEEPITDSIIMKQIDSSLENKSIKKFYRYKHRYSFTSTHANNRFDLTLTKSATGMTFKSSGVLGKEETYEVEVEYIGDPLTVKSDTKNILTQSYISSIYDLLKWSQSSFAITTHSERTSIFEEYINLVFPNSVVNKKIVQEFNRDATSIESRDYFISMDVMPLDMDKILSDKKGNYYVRDGYSVTEKADGEHYLLFISGNDNYKGSIYLINNRMEIKHTGLKMENETLHKSLFDGELVLLKDGNTPNYLLFDCLFFGGRDVRGLPLYEKDSPITDIADINNRYQALIKTIEQYKVISLSIGSNLEINRKQYKFCVSESEKSILQLAGEVYVPDKYKYNLDGLIFTPYGEPYPKASLGEAVRWKRLLKWKPIDQLSIDFLVEIIRKNGNEVVKTDYDAKNKTEWKYKEAHLRVLKTGPRRVKQIIDFVPSKNTVNNLHVIRLKLDEDGETRAHDGNIIYSGSVIEFTYNADEPIGYQWIPIRFRPDKTAKGTPNAFSTADNTWSIIKYPVTESLVTGKTKPTHEMEVQYYTQYSESLTKLVDPLKRYHNAIKSIMINGIADKLRSIHGASYEIDLLDPSVGRGGDLYKWHKAKINYVLGIDVDKNNLTNDNDGAMERYRKLGMEDLKHQLKAYFIWGDSSRRINTGEAGLDSENRSNLLEIMSKRGPASFDIVSCQFALHYFCGSQKTLDDFLYNVSVNLKRDGYFIATTLDGKKVYDVLKDKESISGFKSGIRIWEIKREYTNSEPFANIGQRINVYNISIGQEIPEYLVNFDHLLETAKQFGMEPIKETELKNLVGISSFEKPPQSLLGDSNKMVQDEKTYSFMNNYLIFKKVGSISKKNLEEDVKTESPKKEKIIVPIVKKTMQLKKNSN